MMNSENQILAVITISMVMGALYAYYAVIVGTSKIRKQHDSLLYGATLEIFKSTFEALQRKSLNLPRGYFEECLVKIEGIEGGTVASDVDVTTWIQDKIDSIVHVLGVFREIQEKEIDEASHGLYTFVQEELLDVRLVIDALQGMHNCEVSDLIPASALALREYEAWRSLGLEVVKRINDRS